MSRSLRRGLKRREFEDMADYSIEIAKYEDKDLIQSFIENHWKKNHSLVVSSSLFDFQHYNKEKNNYNYIVAKSVVDGHDEIISLMGFIPTSQYDKHLFDNGDYWGAIWKKRDDINDDKYKSTGFEVFQRIFSEPNFHSYAAIGISKIALKIYKFWGCKTGYLSHYYILNNKCSDFRIAGNVDKTFLSAPSDYKDERGWSLKTLEPAKLENLNVRGYYRPQKSIEYLINRYAKHPIYQYGFWGVYNNDELKTILVIRKVIVDNHAVIRIVDVLGKLEGTLYEEFLKMISSESVEYIDLINYGVDERTLFRMGFRKLDLEGELIIPNYFEPFEQRNVILDIAYKSDYENYVAFKGDSDQDRPNVL